MLLILKEGKLLSLEATISEAIESSVSLIEDESEKSAGYTMALFGVSAYAKEIERTA
tara:strand:- start:3330 stop:3500 length:171 start_codon:yes stop_codon:yes gene_type:complete